MRDCIKTGSETFITARPFVKWVGGKRQLMPELRERIPSSFNRYFEPMVGGGALFFSLNHTFSSSSSSSNTPSSSNTWEATISDVNEELINAYRVIQNSVELLIKDLKIHCHTEEYFYQLRDKDRSPSYKKWGHVKRASRLIYLNKTCYNGLYRVNSKGQFNTPFGDYKNPTIVDEENLLLCHQALQGVNIELASFTSVLNTTQKNDFVYFDPPYAPLSATSNFTHYNKGGFTNEMQTELRDTCRQLDSNGVFFMLSNSNAPAILELYKDFNIIFVDADRRINSVAMQRGYVKEVIVTNY